jgi:hypothetical protein
MRILILILSLFFALSAFGQTKMSDREADGLKGKVKSVTTVRELIESKNFYNTTLGKQRDLIESYNLDGTQTEAIDYEFNSKDTYTIIDGDLTAKYSKLEERPQNEGLVLIAPPLKNKEQPTQPKDDRYNLKYKFKYDDKGRRVELAFYGNTGIYLGKIEYKYDEKGFLIEERRYNEGSSLKETEPNVQFVYKYDASGNLVEEKETSYRPDKNTVRTRTYDNYKLDSQGNWITRTVTSLSEYQGKELKAVWKYSRKIEYYK